MQRVTRATAVAQMPAPPAAPGSPGYFTGGDPIAGLQATVPGYEWFNTVQEELVNVILALGLALDRGDNTQLLQALRRAAGTAVTLVSASRALTLAECGLVLVDAAGGAVTVTLPAASALAGATYRLVRVDASANAVTLAAAGADTIDGVATAVLPAQFASQTVVSRGTTTWHSVAGLAASATRPGVSRYATPAEAIAGVLTTAALTPAALAAALAALFPTPTGTGLRVLAVQVMGATGGSTTTSTSWQTTGVSGWYTRAKAGSTLLAVALIDGQSVGGASGGASAWELDHYVNAAWASLGITAVQGLSAANVTVRGGVSAVGVVNDTSTSQITLRLAHKAQVAGTTVTTGAASTLLIIELG